MQKIGDDLFAYQTKYPPDARAEYKYTINGKWELDPLNSNKMDNGVGGENNVFTMPGYSASKWIGFPIDGKTNGSGRIVAPGKIEEFALATKSFGSRKIRVYVPGGNTTARHPVMYFQDGSQYIDRTSAVKIQEHLVEAGKLEPFVMVFIDPQDRMKEYWANDQWADFVANELVPEIDKRYRTVANRDGRAVLGASLGGITSLHIGVRHPDKFSRLGGQSSSFWVDNERVVKELEKLDPATAKFKFYIDDGTFEGVDDSRRVNVMLRGKGYPVTYVEGGTGHNWTAWRDRLADAFIALMN
jgi:enterochelin esterase family protein